jgi:peptide/nickel transport system ATP-binding protein
MQNGGNVLEIDKLKVYFPVRKGLFSRISGYVKAVDDVSFTVRRGETLALVGESGSGKSTIARTVAGLVKATGGTVKLNGRLGMVFQDPLGSLNPRQTVGEIITSVPMGFEKPDAQELIDLVELGRSMLGKFPHEMSGGERQRVCIARALAVKPALLVCDEALSALDLSIRSQVLDLLNGLKDRLSLSMLFISHDLGVVRHIAERIVVMQRGKAVEQGLCREVLEHPESEYVKNLIAAVPRIKYGRGKDAPEPVSRSNFDIISPNANA